MSPNTKTLFCLFESSAATKGADILFADETEQCSGQHAIQTVKSLANGLSELGVKKQDRVAFLCDSSVRHILSFFACQTIAAVPCALHIRNTANNIANALDWLEAGLLIVDNKYRDLALDALKMAGKSMPVIALDEQDSKNEVLSYTTLLGSESKPGIRLTTSIDDPAMIILSSGTTGKPKGIVHSQRTLHASALAGEQVFGKITEKDSVILAMAPSFAAWNHVAFPFLAYKAKIVFNHGFDADLYIDTIRKEQISHAALVPTAWRRVLKLIQNDKELSSLRSLFFSGEPGTKDFIDTISIKLPSVEIRSAYLSSEGGDASACVADSEILLKDKPTIGKPITGASLRIIDPQGSIDDVLPQGESGEIAIKSESIARGYWKDERLSGQKFNHGWWRSGDLGYIDDSGNLNIGGRNDNMIITGGLKVHAEEVEAALMQHPAVSMAAIIGKPDPEWGQRIEAFVIKKADVTMDEIIKYCRDEALLSPFKLPKQIHFRENLPTGATGKIYRRGLLEELQ